MPLLVINHHGRYDAEWYSDEKEMMEALTEVRGPYTVEKDQRYLVTVQEHK